MSLKAILIDLDDTLLSTNMERFIPIYLQSLGLWMKNFMQPEELIKLVLESTQKMMINDDPALTNEEVFYHYFNSKINFSSTDFKTQAAQFYDMEFPKLGKNTKKVPFADEFVKQLFDAGFKVVIATNPLFPAKAIEHRIYWAGLSKFRFDLITTYENSHFCKPSIKYYNEILEKIGVKPEEAVMVGDDVENDIIPAKNLGMDAFLIFEIARQDKSGSLEDCLNWIMAKF
ncbi:MAG: HAD family hydrolase [Calditrichaceae bacterium]